MNRDAIFDDISIMGRVIYIIYVIEIYIKEREVTEDWNRLLEALWSFPEFDKCIDDYAYKVIECTPETILDKPQKLARLLEIINYPAIQDRLMLNISYKTITKYTNELIELGLIHTKMGNFREGKSTEYSLSDNWKKKIK